MKKYIIGDICFSWDGGTYNLKQGDYFKKFEVDNSYKADIRFKLKYVSLKEYTNNECLESNHIYELYLIDGEKFLIYHWRYSRWAFGVWLDRIDCNIDNECYFDLSMKKEYPMTDDWFFGLCGLTKALLKKEVVVFHASYINYNGNAILFSGPSQTGKSTQADLWNKYLGAEIVNGDRVIIRNNNGKWFAYGYPSCGSSKICKNRTLPISAIVMLEQGNENKIIPVRDSDKVRSITAGMELYKWDVESKGIALGVSDQLVQSVPVVKYSCRPDRDSVYKLKEYIDN